MIVFSTTCKGRAQHIEQTLPLNMRDNADYPDCKFLILNYNSPDNLLDYLVTEHKSALKSGRLVVYSTAVSGPFHMGNAKNMAHRCAMLEGADVLVTLDADNFTGPGFAQFIADNFRGNGTFMCPDFETIKNDPANRPARGFAGRLAISPQDFIKAGGYDERFDTWRGEDMDLIARLRRMGYNQQFFDNCHLDAVRHGAGVRFKEYPHAKKYENSYEMKLINSGTDTVVNYGNIGKECR